jgi:hypothetical protein
MYDALMTTRRRSAVAAICLCACAVPRSWAYPSGTLPFEILAQAPVIATCIVEEASRDSLPAGSVRRVVAAHALLRVLRSFPQSAFAPGERIRLDYEALPEGDQGMSGPDVPRLKPGDTLALPLKLNSQPSTAPWRLIADEGRGLVIPAIASGSRFAGPPKDGRAFLLHEIASALIGGTRREVFAEASYVSEQNAITPELMSLLHSKLGARDDRWYQIAAAILSSLGIPRPSVADFLIDKDVSGGGRFAGSLITAVIQELGPSQRAKETLVHHLLVNSDIASWGVGMTLREFAQEPSLIRELRQMLKARSSGTLNVARDILITGQREIWQDATTLSLYYLSKPGVDPSELQAACSVIRDFGTDEQFGQLLGQIRSSQYRDQPHYDELWRNILWSNNSRERDVLEVLLKDDRMYQSYARYSDIARGELTRIQNLKQ